MRPAAQEKPISGWNKEYPLEFNAVMDRADPQHFFDTLLSCRRINF
jgi:hypothetical protein